LGCFANRVSTIDRLAANLPPFVSLEQGAHTVSQYLVVIRDQNT
jgi:hypothetical protein